MSRPSYGNPGVRNSPPILKELVSEFVQPINTVDMHTTGEPTRIIYAGFPELQGVTLLQKRADAQLKHDYIRGRLMLEPRGHQEMYGALLVNETELTATGEADIGVLFMHKTGWSTMCGHASIALGRFLVDFDAAACPHLFPKRQLRVDKNTMTTSIRLHCPCGVVNITVPVISGSQGQLNSDAERMVSFVIADTYATGINIEIGLPPTHKWPELGEKTKITADFCYGGAFYCVVPATELGFSGGLENSTLNALQRATAILKDVLTADAQFKKFYEHPKGSDMGFLYGIIVSDDKQGKVMAGTLGAETGLCFFGAQQVDRSPCGSGTAARCALAHARRSRWPGEKWTYHCPLSNLYDGSGAFTARVVGQPTQLYAQDGIRDVFAIQIEGRAFYTGFATFALEVTDPIGTAGFLL